MLIGANFELGKCELYAKHLLSLDSHEPNLQAMINNAEPPISSLWKLLTSPGQVSPWQVGGGQVVGSCF